MPDVHPAISKKIDELMSRAKELVDAQTHNLDILLKTIDLKDLYGIKMRVHEVVDFADKIRWISAQIEALRSIPYDMAAEGMTPKRRTSSTQMLAVVIGDKKGDGE